MRTYAVVGLLFQAMLFASTSAFSADDSGRATGSEVNRQKPAITRDGSEFSAIAQYYEVLNSQLDKRLKRTPRDPFTSRVEPAPVDPVSPNAAPFTPSRYDREDRGSFLGSAVNRNDSGIPVMTFQGFIEQGEDKAALLHIDGIGVMVVREGDQVGLQQLSSELVIQVVRISDLNLVVETGTLGKKGQQLVIQ